MEKAVGMYEVYMTRTDFVFMLFSFIQTGTTNKELVKSGTSKTRNWSNQELVRMSFFFFLELMVNTVQFSYRDGTGEHIQKRYQEKYLLVSQQDRLIRRVDLEISHNSEKEENLQRSQKQRLTERYNVCGRRRQKEWSSLLPQVGPDNPHQCNHNKKNHLAKKGIN